MIPYGSNIGTVVVFVIDNFRNKWLYLAITRKWRTHNGELLRGVSDGSGTAGSGTVSVRCHTLSLPKEAEGAEKQQRLRTDSLWRVISKGENEAKEAA